VPNPGSIRLAQRFGRNLLACGPLRAYLGDVQLQFGDFTLDTGLRQLSCGGVDRHLSPQGIELLQLLLDNRPRALSKREIYEHLWRDASFSDATLSNLVDEVRRALNETAVRPNFLRTVPRFGYAFHGDAYECSPPAPQRVDARARGWLALPSGPICLHDGEYVLGREEDVTVRFDSLSVSRRHARILVSSDGATIDDLDSRNGTYLNGERLIGPVLLADGDEIALGLMTLRFSVTDPRSSRHLPEPGESIRRPL
jgi:DNA-binding winged helix-turn-helix (wHTH) protein